MATIERAAPAWRTLLGDALGAVAMIWMIPVAILVVGSPIVLVVALVRWLL